ncbi:S1C family serine protease [Pirellulaceae bacterium SH501]
MIRKALVAFGLVGFGVIIGVTLHGGLRFQTATGQPPLVPGGPMPSVSAPVPATNPIPEFAAPEFAAPAYGAAPSNGSSNGSVPPPAPLPIGIDMGDGFYAMTAEEALNVSVYDRANRSVVNISTTSLRPESLLVSMEVEGNGSGVIMDKRGLVLTNYHVISGSQKVTVTLFNGDAYPASLVGQDADNDLAVLQINAPETSLFPIAWGDSSNLRVGQHVVAIGNPFGFERTMTTGIISSLNRQIRSKTKQQIHSVIQIDAALNQGNSGGPLLNSRAELIGLNTAIATRSGDNAGIGFAIPVNTIKRVVSQLLVHGKVIRPTIGILQVFETDRGLLVVNLTPGGPAERAGMRGSKLARRKNRVGLLQVEQEVVDHSQSDLIIGIDGQKVKRSDDLLGVIESKRPGDQIVLTVIREGETMQIPITLGGKEPN